MFLLYLWLNNCSICERKRLIKKIFWLQVYIKSFFYYLQPDSKKVGTLYKLWIKTECNDVEVSNFNIFIQNTT